MSVLVIAVTPGKVVILPWHLNAVCRVAPARIQPNLASAQQDKTRFAKEQLEGVPRVK
jgi:hypothetical protein